MKPIRDVLRTFVRDNFLYGQEVTFCDEDSFLEEGIVDSTGVLELVTFLEEQFEIIVDDEELVPANLDSIENIDRFVASKRQEAVAV